MPPPPSPTPVPVSPTALVLEADASALLSLGKCLDELNIRYKRNTTGAKFAAQLDEVQPDFIILDTDLPAANAFEIVGWLRRQPRWRTLPVILLCDPEETVPMHELYACLNKPVPRRQLSVILTELLHELRPASV